MSIRTVLVDDEPLATQGLRLRLEAHDDVEVVATAANGCAAFGSYKPDPGGGFAPWGLQVIEVSGDRIVGHHNFLDTTLFEAFGLPAHL